MSGNCHFFLCLLWAIQSLSSLIVWQLTPNVHLFTLGVFRVATQHVEEGWSYRNLCLFTIFTPDRDRFHSFIKECNFEDFFPAFFFCRYLFNSCTPNLIDSKLRCKNLSTEFRSLFSGIDVFLRYENTFCNIHPIKFLLSHLIFDLDLWLHTVNSVSCVS